MRSAPVINGDSTKSIRGNAVFVQVEFHDGTGMSTSTNHTGKNKITETINDQSIFVDFYWLHDMGMSTNDSIGAGID